MHAHKACDNVYNTVIVLFALLVKTLVLVAVVINARVPSSVPSIFVVTVIVQPVCPVAVVAETTVLIIPCSVQLIYVGDMG